MWKDRKFSQNGMIIPTPTDVHSHLRGGPREGYKGDLRSETAAAVYGGYTCGLAMPNTNPPRVDDATLEEHFLDAETEAYCLIGLFAGATEKNADSVHELSSKVCGLKIYMNNTTGDLKITDIGILNDHFKNWKGSGPICVHAEEEFGSLSTALLLARRHNKPLHVCHVSTEKEVELIRKAKESDWPVTCEVTPHHLLFTQDDLSYLGGYGRVKPELKTKKDQDALWGAVRSGVIDIIATDHSPHTKEEKESDNPPSGIPGLETTIPLMLTAVAEGKLTIERFVEMISINPQRIFHLPHCHTTYTKIDLSQTYYMNDSDIRSRCGYTPYKDHKMTGRICEVCILGHIVYINGEISDIVGRQSLVIKNYNGNN